MKWILYCIFVLQTALQAQQPVNFHDIPLPSTGLTAQPEFSGLAKNDSLLLLLPQYSHGHFQESRDAFLFALPLRQIAGFLADSTQKPAAFIKLPMRHLADIQDELASCWEGLEAIALAGNYLYVTVETNQRRDSGYLLRGRITGTEIIMDTRYRVALPKPGKYCGNTGFESLCFFPERRELLSLFEFNTYEKQSTGFTISTRRPRKYKSIPVPTTWFRMTDIAAEKDTVFGLIYYWGGEYDCYAKAWDSLIKTAVPPLHNSNLNDAGCSFARIVSWNRSTKPAAWEVLIPSISSARTNWEGMVRWGNGFLLISDSNQRNPLDTRLVYVEVP